MLIEIKKEDAVWAFSVGATLPPSADGSTLLELEADFDSSQTCKPPFGHAAAVKTASVRSGSCGATACATSPAKQGSKDPPALRDVPVPSYQSTPHTNIMIILRVNGASR
jgi:hypothetical protein